MSRPPTGEAAAQQARAADVAPPAVTTTTLLMVRHGESADDGDDGTRFRGCRGIDPPLTARGARQADLLGARLSLRDDPATLVVTSPLARCQETAEIIASRLRLSVRMTEDLRPPHYGAWEGLDREIVTGAIPEEVRRWRDGAAAPAGGESLADLADRLTTCRDKLLARYRGGTLILVSHALPIGVLACRTLRGPLGAAYGMRPELASLTVTTHPPGAGEPGSLRSLNDTGHLLG